MTEKRTLIDGAGQGPPGLDRITPEIAELVGEAILHDFGWVGRQGVEVHTNESGVYIVGIDSVGVPEGVPAYYHDAHSRELWSGSYEDAFALIDFVLGDRRDDAMPLAENENMALAVERGSPHGNTR